MPADCLLARRSTARLIDQLVQARLYSRDMHATLRRATVPDRQITPLRRRSRRAAWNMSSIQRRVYVGDSSIIRNHRRYRDFVSVAQLERFVDTSMDGLAMAVYHLSQGLELVRPRSPDWRRVRDSDMVHSRKQLRQLVEAVMAQLDSVHIDASAADLRSGAWTVGVLANVIWTERTAWRPAVEKAVRAQSRELSPGVFLVTGG